MYPKGAAWPVHRPGASPGRPRQRPSGEQLDVKKPAEQLCIACSTLTGWALNGKSPIATTNSVDYKVGVENELPFPALLSLKANTGHTFVLRTGGWNYFSVAIANNNPYSGGAMVRGSGAIGTTVQFNPAAGFAADGSSDLWFIANIQ